MKAMILAAGLGTRLRPLTEKTPKPLVTVNDMPLLQYHIENLVAAGISDIVINHAWLGEQIEEFVGDGSRFSCHIQCSAEEQPLETAGGILKALPMLGDSPFVVVNGDIWAQYNFRQLLDIELGEDLAHLVLVENPAHNPEGDFHLQDGRLLASSAAVPKKTFAGISLMSAALFADLPEGKQALKPLLDQAIKDSKVQASLYKNYWCDVGTLQRLQELRDYVAAQAGNHVDS